jgi:sulfite reductase alpha subunit-like flavoprotein
MTSTMHYLFRFIEHYQVEMTFETFVSLSDAIAPRLFTIASSSLVYPTCIHIVDSLEEEGLCSKFFKRNPKYVRVEVKESTFQDAMINEKVIFISAGTGFAPFKGYL